MRDVCIAAASSTSQTHQGLEETPTSEAKLSASETRGKVQKDHQKKTKNLQAFSAELPNPFGVDSSEKKSKRFGKLPLIVIGYWYIICIKVSIAP